MCMCVVTIIYYTKIYKCFGLLTDLVANGTLDAGRVELGLNKPFLCTFKTYPAFLLGFKYKIISIESDWWLLPIRATDLVVLTNCCHNFISIESDWWLLRIGATDLVFLTNCCHNFIARFWGALQDGSHIRQIHLVVQSEYQTSWLHNQHICPHTFRKCITKDWLSAHP